MDRPLMSLRAGSALDDYQTPPEFDQVHDELTPKYLETYYWGLPHLDAQSWRYYLPHFLSNALKNIDNPLSNATDAFLFSLRPPDRDPPRFSSLMPTDVELVVTVLDKLAFSVDSVWHDSAMIALEEYWAPGATYK